MRKSAFTMIELVFVIVVAGILAAVFIPRMERDNIAEAAYQVARHIRLTQHHAMVEDRFNDAPAGVDWRETNWRITFVNGTSGECYQIHADRDGNGGTPASSEMAVDPMTKKGLFGGSSCNGTNDDVLLWKSFGINAVTVCGVATSSAGIKNLAFDHLGRVGQISGNTMNLLANDCTVHLTTSDGHSADVLVTKETGFVKVANIDGTAL
uniref:pilus assembly FimT family protein n=1 Tax=Thiomicrolovo subterrani TaxID=3131934 RepID=UPI003F6316F5